MSGLGLLSCKLTPDSPVANPCFERWTALEIDPADFWGIRRRSRYGKAAEMFQRKRL
jgi:hypothetical protein